METKDLELEKILNKYRYAGISIIHTTKDRIDYMVNYGKKDLELEDAISSDTIYRIASVSKVIVAIGVMTLVEKGILDIYQDISKYLGYEVRNPKHPDKKITLEQIMTQTSSITDGFDDPDYGYDAVNVTSIDVPLKELLTNPNYKYYNPRTYLDAAPGEEWRYSNFGCGILACIIESVTGKYFTDYIKEVLLDPLEIDGGFRIEQVVKKENVASLYCYENEEFRLSRNLKQFERIMFPKYELGNNFRGPAGGLFISPKDLSKIMLMLMNKGTYNGKQILKEETVKDMESVHWSGYSYDPEYKAKGLQLNLMSNYSKQTLKGHFGNAYGLRSYMLYNNDNGYIFMCSGGNYVLDQDHMVPLQKEVLFYLINKFEG